METWGLPVSTLFTSEFFKHECTCVSARRLHFSLSKLCAFNSAKMELRQGRGIGGIFFALRVSMLIYSAILPKDTCPLMKGTGTYKTFLWNPSFPPPPAPAARNQLLEHLDFNNKTKPKFSIANEIVALFHLIIESEKSIGFTTAPI